MDLGSQLESVALRREADDTMACGRECVERLFGARAAAIFDGADGAGFARVFAGARTATPAVCDCCASAIALRPTPDGLYRHLGAWAAYELRYKRDVGAGPAYALVAAHALESLFTREYGRYFETHPRYVAFRRQAGATTSVPDALVDRIREDCMLHVFVDARGHASVAKLAEQPDHWVTRAPLRSFADFADGGTDEVVAGLAKRFTIFFGAGRSPAALSLTLPRSTSLVHQRARDVPESVLEEAAAAPSITDVFGIPSSRPRAQVIAFRPRGRGVELSL